MTPFASDQPQEPEPERGESVAQVRATLRRMATHAADRAASPMLRQSFPELAAGHAQDAAHLRWAEEWIATPHEAPDLAKPTLSCQCDHPRYDHALGVGSCVRQPCECNGYSPVAAPTQRRLTVPDDDLAKAYRDGWKQGYAEGVATAAALGVSSEPATRLDSANLSDGADDGRSGRRTGGPAAAGAETHLAARCGDAPDGEGSGVDAGQDRRGAAVRHGGVQRPPLGARDGASALAPPTTRSPACEQDTARLDWLEANHPRVGMDEDGQVRVLARTAGGQLLATERTFRAAIDAARLAPPAGGTGGATA